MRRVGAEPLGFLMVSSSLSTASRLALPGIKMRLDRVRPKADEADFENCSSRDACFRIPLAGERRDAGGRQTGTIKGRA